MKDNGSWIKLYRKTLENPVVMKDACHFALWCWLLLSVYKFPKEVTFGGKKVMLQPGQMTTGRKKIAEALGEQESKIYRTLKHFESEHLIEQVTDHKCTLITIVRWDEYQSGEQDNEQEVNKKRTRSEQVTDTNRERREREKERERGFFEAPTLADVSSYVREHGYQMDPAAYFDYYSETNWRKKNGQPIRDWKASVRTWERREKEFAKGKDKDSPKKPAQVEPPKYKQLEPDPEVETVQMPADMRKKLKKIEILEGAL